MTAWGYIWFRVKPHLIIIKSQKSSAANFQSLQRNTVCFPMEVLHTVLKTHKKIFWAPCSVATMVDLFFYIHWQSVEDWKKNRWAVELLPNGSLSFLWRMLLFYFFLYIITTAEWVCLSTESSKLLGLNYPNYCIIWHINCYYSFFYLSYNIYYLCTYILQLSTVYGQLLLDHTFGFYQVSISLIRCLELAMYILYINICNSISIK